MRAKLGQRLLPQGLTLYQRNTTSSTDTPTSNLRTPTVTDVYTYTYTTAYRRYILEPYVTIYDYIQWAPLLR